MEKQFKNPDIKRIVRPRPELKGMERKFDYKKYFAELKEKEEEMEIKKWTEFDGEPWAIFAEGHVDINEFVNKAWPDEYNEKKQYVEHAYLVDKGGECNHHICEKNEPGSFPVTIYKY